MPKEMTLYDIRLQLGCLGTVVENRGIVPWELQTLCELIGRLKRYIPGLGPEATTDPDNPWTRLSASALEKGDIRNALGCALSGLYSHPFHPMLYYRAGLAVQRAGYYEAARCLLLHALWINPGLTAARAAID